MKKLKCPQCQIDRFFVKNELGENLLVNVTEDLEVIPVKENESVEGFDLTVLYCLGCSWTGSPRNLRSHKHY